MCAPYWTVPNPRGRPKATVSSTPHVEARAEGRVRVWSWVFSFPLKSASEAQDEHSAPGAVVLTMGGNY